MVLVDSSIWIPNMRRDGPLEIKVAVEALLEEYQALLCGPVKLEVLGSIRTEHRRKLDFWFSVLPYRKMSDQHWTAAMENARKLRDQGISAPPQDVLIATLAIDWDVRVFARDAHFDAMAPVLGLRLYQPGYGGSYLAE